MKRSTPVEDEEEQKLTAQPVGNSFMVEAHGFIRDDIYGPAITKAYGCYRRLPTTLDDEWSLEDIWNNDDYQLEIDDV